MGSQKSDSQEDKAITSTSAGCQVFLTNTAEVSYLTYFEKAKKARERGDLVNAHCTTLRQIDEALEKIIPQIAFDPSYALAGVLKPIFRLRKGRMRICWVGSPDKRRVFVLFISESLRKAGDANDPYRIIEKMMQNGTFDEFFKELGIKPPPNPAAYRVQ